MEKLIVETHEGKIFTVQVENYDPVSLNQQINDNQIMTLEIGGLIFSRISIKFVYPATETD